MVDHTKIRLQKRLAQLGVASRRESERFIAAGRVKVNGRVVTEQGTSVTAADQIAVDNQPVGEEGTLTVVLYKPVGVICARSDPQGRPIVYDLLPKGVPFMGHVGRLDYNTEGVLLFTNVLGLADGLLKPDGAVPRTYEAKIRGRLRADSMARIEAGIPLDGRPTKPIVIERIGGHRSRHDWLRLTLFEGRNRHVHRIFEAVGHSVTRLVRVSFASVSAEGLRPGESRALEDHEVAQLLAFADAAR